MKRKFSTRIIAGIATSAVLAVGSLSFTAINAIADEAVSYYGLSADGTVISGTVTDYTKIASYDTAWGIAGKETWYVADGIFNIYTTNPLDLKGNVNVILKNGAEVIVSHGIAGTDATITFYSESESASGVIGFIGATGDDFILYIYLFFLWTFLIVFFLCAVPAVLLPPPFFPRSVAFFKFFLTPAFLPLP